MKHNLLLLFPALLLFGCNKGCNSVQISDCEATVSADIPTVVTVNWTTNIDSTGYVAFGPGTDLSMQTHTETTPATEHSTSTAPSSTRSARSTSTVKSTCPGVSIRLMWCSFQVHEVAAEAMVIPRSRSSSMESMVAPTPSLPRTSCMARMRRV